MNVSSAGKERFPRFVVVTESDSSRQNREDEERGYHERRYEMAKGAASEERRPEVQKFSEDTYEALESFKRSSIPPRKWLGIRWGKRGLKFPSLN